MHTLFYINVRSEQITVLPEINPGESVICYNTDTTKFTLIETRLN